MKYLLHVFIVFFIGFSSAFAAPTLIPDEKAGEEYKGLIQNFRTGSFELTDIPLYIKYLTDNLISVGFSLALIMIIFAGYKYLAGSYIDDESQAKTLLKNIFIGLTVVVFSWMIIDFVIRFITT
jgi:hypothetical protein